MTGQEETLIITLETKPYSNTASDRSTSCVYGQWLKLVLTRSLGEESEVACRL